MKMLLVSRDTRPVVHRDDCHREPGRRRLGVTSSLRSRECRSVGYIVAYRKVIFESRNFVRGFWDRFFGAADFNAASPAGLRKWMALTSYTFPGR